MRLPKLEGHLFTRALFPFAATLTSVICLYVVIDLFSNINRIANALSNSASIVDLLTLYLLKLPETIVLVAPMVLALSLAFSTIGFIKRGEYIAILSAGICMRRGAAPFIFAGLLFASFIYLTAEYAIPYSAPKLTQLNGKLFSKASELKDVVTVEVAKSGNQTVRRVYHIQALRRLEGLIKATNLHCYEAGDKGFATEYYATTAYLSAGFSEWLFENGVKFSYDSSGIRTKTEAVSLPTTLPPAAYVVTMKPSSFRSSDLLALSHSPRFGFELCRRVAMPLALFFLGMIIVPISFRMGSSGVYASVGVAVSLALAYFAFDFAVSATFADKYPSAAWALPIVAALGGIRAMLKLPT